MWFSRLVAVCAPLVSVVVAQTVDVAQGNASNQVYRAIALKLSGQSSITFQEDPPTRWSTFNGPDPLFVVNVGREEDVALVVEAANQYNVPFLAQNGGAGWSSTIDISGGIIINLASLKQFSLSADKTQATIGGGLVVKETIDAAFAQDVQVVTGNCNCVGTLGAYLGGGYGNLMGLHGLGIDQVIALNVVTPDGKRRTVSQKSDPDLFWAMRGAGPNFGIVTSAVINSYPVSSPDDMLAWTAGLTFDGSKVEAVVEAINNLQLTPETNCFMYYLSSPVDGKTPIIFATPFMYKGNEAAGREFFKALYDIGPIADSQQTIPWTEWNTGADFFCAYDGARKPSYSAGTQTLDPQAWREIWNSFVEFQSQPGAQSSAILMERYDLTKAQSFGSVSASFPLRDVEFQSVAIAWYNDTSLDAAAETFGTTVRDTLRASSGLEKDLTYVNFAYGDEPGEVVYGASLGRLQELKKRFDPKNRLASWFGIDGC